MDIEKLIERLWNYKELEQVKRERGAAIEAANGLDKMIGRAWGED